MTEKNITIQEAAELSGKSIQTIRRAIKAKKIKFRRKSTPQGFNYLIDKSSLCCLYKIEIEETAKPSEYGKTKFLPKLSGENMIVEIADFKSFVKTMETLINNHSEERQNFLRLVDNLQEKIFVLENQLNLIRGPVETGKGKWYQFWK